MPSWRERIWSVFLAPRLRPWALLTPLLVLLIALPLLRPLVLPEAIGADEKLILASVESLVERRGMALDQAIWQGRPGTVTADGRVYAADPPVFAVILAGPGWLATKAGVTFANDEALMAFWLTLVGVTLPTALGASMVYRMGRLFELSRPRRALLAILCVMGCGWISYATVLNPHAPAAGLLLMSCATILYVAAAASPARMLWVLILAGQLAALAAAVDPWTLPLVIPLPLVVLAMRLPWVYRGLGVLMLTIGAAPVLWLHSAWSLTTFNSILTPQAEGFLLQMMGDPDAGVFERLWELVATTYTALLGRHGLLTHFPLLLVGVVGMVLVMRKHWPAHAKMLAAITFVGTATILTLSITRGNGFDGSMFAVQWAVVALPLVTFWLGAVVRRDLSTRWRVSIAAVAIMSVIVSIAGARNPIPEAPYTTHTAVGALERWSQQSARRADEVDPLARVDRP